MTKLWLDANVLIRYLTNDPPEQAGKVQKLMEQAEAGQVRLCVDRLIAAEVIWALGSSIYKYPMAELAETLVPFFSAEHLEVEDRALIIGAIEFANEKNVDFVDAYLSLKVADISDVVITFDKSDFKKLPGSWRTP